MTDTRRFFVKWDNTWFSVQNLWDRTVYTWWVYSGRSILRLKLPSGRWAAYYERDSLQAYAAYTNLPDLGVTEVPLRVRRANHTWTTVASMATGAAMVVVEPGKIFILDRPSDQGGFCNLLGAYDPDDLWNYDWPTGNPASPIWHIDNVNVDHMSAVTARGIDIVERVAYQVIDMNFLQELCHFYDGYIEFRAGGACSGPGSTTAIGRLGIAGSLMPETTGITRSGTGDWLDYGLPLRGLSARSLQTKSDMTAVINTWLISDLPTPWGTSDPFVHPGGLPSNLVGYDTYIFPITPELAASRDAIVLCCDVFADPAPGTAALFTVNARIVLRS